MTNKTKDRTGWHQAASNTSNSRLYSTRDNTGNSYSRDVGLFTHVPRAMDYPAEGKA